MQKTDIIYKIGNKPKWGNHEELRYSIRSAVNNFKDLKDIYIVGTLPDWAQNIKHIPAEDKYKKNKDASIIEKLLIAFKDDSLTESVLNVSDDQLFIHAVTTNMFFAWTINSDLRRMENKKSISKYGQRVKNTINILKSQNLPCNLYECHVPMLINKEKYIEALSKFDYTKGVGLCGNTIYFNSILNNGEQPVENVRSFIRKPSTTAQIITACRGKLFLGYQRRALNKSLKEYLKQRFPDKSIYEK